MKILCVEIENFLMLGQARLKLDDRGLVLVQGDNQDDSSAESNGAGKSSLADAISWALYGVTARGVSGDSVINREAKKNCSVWVTLQDGADVYRVERYRKHKEHKNGLRLSKRDPNPANEPIDLTKGTDKLTQDEVVKLLGCSLEVFNAAIYAGQEKTPDLPAMTDKTLKLVVEEAAGVDRLQRAYDVARTKLAAAKSEADKQRGVIQSLESNVALQKSQIEDLERRRDQWDVDSAELHRELANLAAIIKADVDTRKAELANLDKPALEQTLADLDAQLAGVKGEESERDRLQRELTQANNAQVRQEAKVRQALLEVQKRKTALEKIDGQIGTPCGECGKSYCEHDLDAAREIAKQKLADAVAAARAEKATLEDTASRSESASKLLEQHTRSMTDVSDVIAAQSRTRAQIQSIEDKERELKERIAECKRTIDKARDEKAKKNPYADMIKEVQERLIKLENALDHARADLADLTAAQAITQDAVDVFSPAGVRAHILDTVTPYLNDRTAHYLNALSDGNIEAVWSTLSTTAKGELREKFNIEVSSKLGADSFAGLSGGQKRKVRLATVMALQDLVASRALKPIRLFVADEIDHALDEAGLERLMGILDEKARERGTVLVISHNSLSDWIRESVTVTCKGGQASVSGVLC